MSTHPTILGEMIRNETEPGEKTSLDVERDLGIPADSGTGTETSRPDLLQSERPAGQRRDSIESE